MERILKSKLRGGKFSRVSDKRSEMMAHIRSKHNKATELKLRSLLISNKINGWMRTYSKNKICFLENEI